MGTNVYTRALDPKIKTPDQVRKWYTDAVSQSQYEDGHSYSGEIGCTSRIYFTGQTVELIDDLEALMDTVSKGDVAVFQVKVINEEMATLVKWRAAFKAAYAPMWNLQSIAQRDPKNKAAAAALRKQRKLAERTKARYDELRRNAAARSSKVRYAFIAACPS